MEKAGEGGELTRTGLGEFVCRIDSLNGGIESSEASKSSHDAEFSS